MTATAPELRDAVPERSAQTAAACQSAPPPLKSTRVALVGFLSLLSGTGLTLLLDRVQTQTLTGHLQVETVPVRSVCDGRIQQFLAEPGTRLQPGTPLAILHDDTFCEQLAAARQEVADCREKLQRARAQAEIELAWRIKTLDEEVFQAQLQVTACLQRQYQSQFERIAWRDFSDLPELVAGKTDPDDVFRFVTHSAETASDLARLHALLRQEAARNQAEVSQAQLELCEQRLKELQQLKSRLPEKVRRAHGVFQAEARLAEAERRWQELQSRSPARTLTTPSYGTLGNFEKQVGDPVRRGETLVTLLDTDRCYVLVEVPSHMLPRIKTARKVRLEFPGGVDRLGCVRKISPQATRKPVKHRRGGRADAFVSVRIDPAGRLWPEMPVGTAVRVWFDR
ncbi:MAG TPA: HlyD family efflux transporter periplasmic adaptor subunit [Planctomycetaceae bacterium]|nr:HlyD family efflux transporter periplasmic adaptor subunit [Planctomycetaceae bacterium]